MKLSQTTIFSGIALLVAAVAFYMLLISPKRAEVTELDDEVTSLESSVAEQEQLIAFGEQARREFPRDYGRLVVLGKAVPDQADTSSQMVQMNSFAREAGVEFWGILLSDGATGSGATAASAAPASTTPAAPAAGTATTGTESTAAAPGSTTTPSATPAPATETAAATLPIGAQVGTAGLATLPYELTFKGDFFGIADYMGKFDSLVDFDGKAQQVEVTGRLMTVDGFLLTLPDSYDPMNPVLDTTMMVTAYSTPSTQGLMAGATPSGPAPGGVPPASPSTTPASTAVAP